MPNASERARLIPASPIRKLVPLAVAAQKRGVHVHYLNIGQPDVFSPDSFWKGVADYKEKTLGYCPSPGDPNLREAALADYRARGIDLKESELLVTSGGSEATFFAFMSCFNPGDQVIVIEPYYANYRSIAMEAGVELVALTSTIESEFSLPTVEKIAQTVTEKTRGILVCNPSNPTGRSFTNQELYSLADLAKSRNLFLIVDEVYRDFNYLEAELTPILTLPGLEQNAVMIDSVSKRLSLCGARVGFLASRNEGVMVGAVKLAQARLSAGALDQAGAAAAILNTPPSYYAEMRAEYKARRDALVKGLSTIPGVICPRIDGAFYAFVQLPVDDSEAFCSWMLQEFEHENETVFMAPAEGFYLTPGLGRNQVRIAYVLNIETLERAVECLKFGLEQYANGTSNKATKAVASV